MLSAEDAYHVSHTSNRGSSMSSTDYQDDPWGRHWCHAPRRNGFLLDTGEIPPGVFGMLTRLLKAIARKRPTKPPDQPN